MTRGLERRDRIADEIKKVAAGAIHHEVKDFDLTMVTVTRCDLTRDYA
jgi:ribosome-binding factor A